MGGVGAERDAQLLVLINSVPLKLKPDDGERRAGGLTTETIPLLLVSPLDCHLGLSMGRLAYSPPKYNHQIQHAFVS